MMEASEFQNLYSQSELFKKSKIILKKEQLACAIDIYNNIDCVVILPTGYGKSFCFLSALAVKKASGEAHAKALVVSPLISLIENQCQNFTENGFKTHVFSTNTSINDGYFKLSYL